MFGTTEARAFLWQNGVMQDLGTLGGTDAQAALINERGQIVGYSYTSSAPSPSCGPLLGFLTTGSFFWDKGKGMVDLGTLGGTCTLATNLNSRGQVVGLSYLTGDQSSHAFVWDRGTLTDLGGGANYGIANAINDAGEIVGHFGAKNGAFHAVLWKNGLMTDLGNLDGDVCTFAASINSRGQVVGGSGGPFCATNQRAFLWEDGGPLVDLNTLIPPGSPLHLAFPETINDRGEIVGVGVLPNGDQHAYLLIPCGEGDEDCGDNAAGAAAVTQAPVTQRPSTATPANPALGGRGMLDRLRSRRFPWYHVPPRNRTNELAHVASPGRGDVS